MRFLINFFLILILVGCESIDLGYIDLIRENNQENIIEDLSPFYNTGYSFIRASKGRNQAVMVLSKFDDGVATWVGANNEIIITQNGIIIETQNLEYDLKIHQPLFSLSNLFKGNLSNYISLSNPDAKFISVLFPAPLSPKTPITSPLFTWKLILVKISLFWS